MQWQQKRNAPFLFGSCVCVRVCCECLCCCCCCSCCSCWHIVSGIRKNTYTSSIHSETRYSHGALTGELNQIEVLSPAFLSVSLTFSLVLSLSFCCACHSLSAARQAAWTCAHSAMRSSQDSAIQTVLSSQLYLDLAITC